jgi:Ca2+-binding RTX toxin-like protein
VFGGAGDDTIKVGALTLPVALNGGDGNDTFQLTGAPVAGSTIDGGTGTNTVVAPNATNAWTISALNTGTVDGASFVNVQNLTGNTGNDTFTFGPAGSMSGLITGGGGSDQIVGANIANAWQITGTNAGNLNGTQFTGIKNLTGGTAIDTFLFGSSGSVGGVINGGSTGGDWLDYSAYTTSISVNLANGTASHTGGVTNIQNVRGGNGANTLTGDAQGNILVGGSGADTITGGSGRSLLIGGKGKDTIKGGSGDDILIGGYTDFDGNDAALMAVFAEWQRTDETYTQRVSNIRGTTSGGLNGSYDLKSTTVHDDGVVDTLTGNAGLDWFFAGSNDKITDLQPGEQVN